MQAWPLLSSTVRASRPMAYSCGTHERTKRSRLSHLGFLGLNLMILLKRTWATGAMPLGSCQHVA
jgi:hypothetical protein